MRPIVLPFIFILFTSCNLITQSKSEPVIVIAPETKPSNFDTNDSSFLKLTVKEDKFEIELLKQVSLIDNINSLDSFLQKNMPLINKEKIVITGLDSSMKNKSLNDLLIKYNIPSVRINTEENH